MKASHRSEILPRVSITGRLVDAHGSPLAALAVYGDTLAGADSESSTVLTDPLGTFAISVAAKSTLVLSYGDAKCPIPRASPIVGQTQDLDHGDIELPALGSVEVEVQDDANRPVPNASVRASLQTSNGVALATDAFGRATARHLPPGSYRFFATHESAGRGNAPIDLAPGADEKLKIELRRAP